jgi:tRNA(fMet)-specific endonuclease VapC
VRGYLLDTNIIVNWYDASKNHHQAVMDRLAAIEPQSILCTSAISWGEMEYGHRAVSDADSPGQVARNAFVERELPICIDVRQSTSIYYGQIRARLFNKYAPRERRRKGLRPEQLADPATALQLGVQENDLWIAAQAFEHNLILVTCDKLDRLSAVTSDLLTIEIWTKS